MPNEKNENPKNECHGGGIFQFAQDVVEKFNGSDKTYPVTKWIQEIEDNQQIFEWSAVQTLLVARRSLIGTAALWLKTERTFKTWEELKTAISKEFPDTLDVKAVHEMMAARTKRENESCLDYMLVMKEMGKRGKMPDYVAIQYIVDGIKDAETRKMMLYGVTTYGDLKEKLKIYELLRSKIKSSSAHRDHRDRRDQHREQKTERQTATTAAGKSTTTTLRCYSCGEKDHVSLDCPHKEKGLKCFKCNEFGHISPECPRHQVRQHNDGKGGGGKPKRTMFGAVNNEQDLSMTDCNKMADDDNVSRSSLTSDGEEVMQIQNKDVNCGIQETKTSLKTKEKIKVNGKYADALIDSGSEVNLIKVDFCNELKMAKPEDEKYIEGYATIAKPLTDLLKKDKGFIFEDEQREV